mmetsp:Transcript_8537/g.22841  ORF Transcript_8537/g.22841 Transcript_8537/m.22841 type:complete len:202 (-) Transcript_8537:967-1572(-)
MGPCCCCSPGWDRSCVAARISLSHCSWVAGSSGTSSSSMPEEARANSSATPRSCCTRAGIGWSTAPPCCSSCCCCSCCCSSSALRARMAASVSAVPEVGPTAPPFWLLPWLLGDRWVAAVCGCGGVALFLPAALACCFSLFSRRLRCACSRLRRFCSRFFSSCSRCFSACCSCCSFWEGGSSGWVGEGLACAPASPSCSSC